MSRLFNNNSKDPDVNWDEIYQIVNLLDMDKTVLYDYIQMVAKMAKAVEFEWDAYNKDKNRDKHKVDFKECEEVFANRPLKTYKDIKHSQREDRFVALGVTNRKRKIYLVFTLRRLKIRIISARDMNRKERSLYEEK